MNKQDVNERFRDLAWGMQVGVLLQGPSAEILMSNPKALELLGISEDQLLGKTSFDPDWNVIHEDGTPFPGNAHPVPEAIATGKAIRNVVMGVYRPATLDRIWLLVDAEPRLNDDGTVREVVCTFVDITKRKQAEEALKKLNEDLENRVRERTSELERLNATLRQTQEKFRTVADFTHDWAFWLDQHDRMYYCSPSCERITGYQAWEFEQDPALLFDIIHPDDIQIFQQHKQSEYLASDGSPEIQFRIIRSDNEIRWIGHVCRPIFDESGNFGGIRGSNRDITARKEIEQLLTSSEQKYKLLSENITDGIFIYRSGKFEYTNKAMNSIFGYDEHEMEGSDADLIIMPDYMVKFEAFLRSEISVNQIRSLEIECKKKDHSTVFVDVLINYIAREKAIYGVVHDITERKQTQKNILKAIIQTEEKERSHFSKELHDGLGPLLSTIKLYLQWAQRPNINKSHTEVLLKAEDILEDALAAVKEISNKLTPHLLTYYGLSSAIQSFADKLEDTSAIRITFTSNATRRLDIEIEAALYRAVIECMNNTLKHSGAKNIYIRLDDSGNQLFLQYRDDGIGFDFEEMVSGQKGLGLFNLQNRIQTIGGKINMVSYPGGGVDYEITVKL